MASRRLNKAMQIGCIDLMHRDRPGALAGVARLRLLDQGTPPSHGRCVRGLPSKWWSQRLQQRVAPLGHTQICRGLSSDTSVGCLHLGPRPAPDGWPDEVHLRTVARQVLAQARGPGQPHGLLHHPEQLAAPPHLQA